MQVPYLAEGRIEAAAENAIACFERKFGGIEEQCVPLEEIAESAFTLDVRCEDLLKFHGASTLGAIWFDERKIRIDDSLNPDLHPDKLGRYRFTLAHEIGHWVLHESIYRARRQQGSLFEASGQPSVVCRAPLPHSKKKPVEWQADYFAGCLLMPRSLVVREFERIKGSRVPYSATCEIAVTQAHYSLTQDTIPTLIIAREIANVLQTSAQAAQIRLIALGLVLVDQPAPQLLTALEIEATYAAPDLY